MKRRALLLWAGAPAVALAQASAPADPLAGATVDINIASRARLESVPGLGPALVQRLLAARPFSDWADVMRRVPGIKAATARRLSEAGLRVAGQPFAANPASAAGSEAG